MKDENRSTIVARIGVAAALVLVAGILAGCASPPDEARYRPSEESVPLPDATGSFAAYLRAVDAHLARTRVPHAPDDPAWELSANAPFEMAPDSETCGAVSGRPERGILLIHGLSDSPYTFRGLARDLARRCFLVRTVLLPGHGTRPGDMLGVDHEDWIAAAEAAFLQLRRDVRHAYAGGFSMGATLAALLALEQDGAAGLALYSPAFADDGDRIWLARYLEPFTTWLDVDPEDNPVRYEAFSTRAAAAYSHLSARLAGRLERGTFEMPVFMAVATDDTVIDAHLAVRIFADKMPHPRSTLHVYTRPETRFPLPAGKRVRVFMSARPADRIATFSHMAPPFSPDDPHYGRNGRYRHCTSFEEPAAYQRCRAAARGDLWYGSHDAQEKFADRTVVRLTFNPYYQEAVAAIDAVLRPENSASDTARR